jgi:hypothetical protein
VVLALAAAIALAVTLSGRSDSPCPDERYGCVVAGPDEPLVIGALFPEGAPGRAGVDALVQETGRVRGRPLEVLSFDGRCSVETAAHAARELATPPPEGHAVVGVVGEMCPQAEVTVARILNDSGIVFVSVRTASDVPATVRFYLESPAGAGGAGPVGLGSTDRAAFAAVSAIRVAAAGVAVRAEGELLVPRTRLRDRLIRAGMTPAP